MLTVSAKIDIYQGLDKVELLTAADVAWASLLALVLMQERISAGQRADGAPLKPYDTKPIRIPKSGVGSQSDNKLTPKGGRETAKGVVYQGGYAQFKAESQGVTSNLPDFKASGNTLRNITQTVTFAESARFEFKEKAVIAQLEAREGAQVFSFSETEQFIGFDAVWAAIAKNLQKGQVPLTLTDMQAIATTNAVQVRLAAAGFKDITQ